MRWLGLLTAGIAATGPGCGAPPGEPADARRPAADGDPTAPDAGRSDAALAIDLRLGTGLDAFVELLDEGPGEMVRGPQGGYHVWGGVRFHLTGWRELWVTYSTFDEAGTMIVGGAQYPMMPGSGVREIGPGEFERVGDPMLVSWGAMPAVGARFRVEASLLDVTERVLETVSRTVVLRDDVPDPAMARRDPSPSGAAR